MADCWFSATQFGDYIVAFDSNLADVIQFTGIAILILGFSNFIWYVLESGSFLQRIADSEKGPPSNVLR